MSAGTSERKYPYRAFGSIVANGVPKMVRDRGHIAPMEKGKGPYLYSVDDIKVMLIFQFAQRNRVAHLFPRGQVIGPSWPILKWTGGVGDYVSFGLSLDAYFLTFELTSRLLRWEERDAAINATREARS